MNPAGAVACSVAVVAALAVPASAQPAARALEALAVPPGTLAAGCVLIDAPSERTGQGQVRSGLWADLPIRSNPWLGDDPRVLTEIRTRMFGPDMVKDAPADRRSATHMQRTLVEGMSGYAAFYRQGDARVAVYALRPDSQHRWTRPQPPLSEPVGDRAVARISIGAAAALVVGDSGPCFESVEQHLRDLAATPDSAASNVPPR